MKRIFSQGSPFLPIKIMYWLLPSYSTASNRKCNRVEAPVDSWTVYSLICKKSESLEIILKISCHFDVFWKVIFYDGKLNLVIVWLPCEQFCLMLGWCHRFCELEFRFYYKSQSYHDLLTGIVFCLNRFIISCYRYHWCR